MKRWLWGTVLLLMTLLFTAVGCRSGESASSSLPVITGPAFLYFYTDN